MSKDKTAEEIASLLPCASSDCGMYEAKAAKMITDYSAQQLKEYREVIRELLPIAEDIVGGMSCFPNHKETQEEKRKLNDLINRANKLID